MRLLRRFPALAFALVLLSIAGLCAAQRSVGLLLVAGTLAAMSWYVTEGPRGRVLPRWVSNILVIGVILNIFRDLLANTNDFMGVLGRFTLLLTLVKLYERRTSRDYAQLLTLSLVLMVTGCMQSNDLLFGIVLLLYMGLGLYVLLLYQLHAAHERARTTRTQTMPVGYRLLPPLRPILGRHSGLHFRLLAFMIGVAGVALSIGVFVGVPRGVGSDLLASFGSPQSNRSRGFTAEVNLTTGGRINASTARVMTVQFLESDRPVRLDGPILLRGAALDRYLPGGVWSTLNDRARTLPLVPGQYERLGMGRIEPSRSVVQRVTFVRAVSGAATLFSLYAPIGVTVDSPVTVRYDPRRQVIQTVPGTRRLLGYGVRVQPDPSDESLRMLTDLITPLGQAGWFTDADGRVAALAKSLLQNANLPTEAPSMAAPDGQRFRYCDDWDWNSAAAQVFTDYLQGPNLAYTLDLSDVRLGGGEDPITAFLFTTRRGHCEFFASALAAMCQSVEIPARLAVGYAVHDYDEQAQQYNVLEGNAHAWVEVATGPHRWMAFDPSPTAGQPTLTDSGGTLAQTVRSVYDRVEGNWVSNVVGFDDTAQGRLMDSFAQGWTRRITVALESVRDWMEQVNAFFNVGPGGYIWMGIVATALVIAVIALVKLMRRSMAIRRTLRLDHMHGAEYRRMLQRLGFYLDMLTVLRRAGVAKPMWQPPLSFAMALQPERPEPARLVREITGVFYDARYGNGAIDRAKLDHAREKVSELARTLGVKR